MAGGAQGGGARPAVGGNISQYQNTLQNYRQGMAGAPSQVPGANIAAPGGGMAQPAVMPQQAPPQPNPGMAQPAVMPQWSQLINALPAYAGPAPQSQQEFIPAPDNRMAQGHDMARAAVMPQEYNTGMMLGGGIPQQAPPQTGNLPPGMNGVMGGPVPSQGPISVGGYQPPISNLISKARQREMPQIMGNPNASPLQRPQTHGNPRMQGQMLRGRR